VLNRHNSTPPFMQRKECEKCGAVWLDGQHYWHTGATGDNKTLSNLVCGIVESTLCINPELKKGHIYGEADTWEKRRGFIDNKMKSSEI